MIDIMSLRRDLIDFFGTAKESNPAATADLIVVENADVNGLLSIAEEVGFDLENYFIDCDLD